MARDTKSSSKIVPQKSLESWIWDAACPILGAKDAPKYKAYILPLNFTKLSATFSTTNSTASPVPLLWVAQCRHQQGKTVRQGLSTRVDLSKISVFKETVTTATGGKRLTETFFKE